MKRNMGMFIGLSHKCAGAVLLTLCAFAPVSRADVTVLDNTGNANASQANESLTFAQVFTMGTSGNISSLTLTLSGAGTSEVYIYAAASGSSPTISYNGAGNALYDLGSVSGSSPTITGLNDSLSAGTYAIVLASSGSAWKLTSSGSIVSQNGSSIGGLYFDDGGTWAAAGSSFAQMNLEAVPEVPATGTVMGFGALAIALGCMLRRKTVSSIA